MILWHGFHLQQNRSSLLCNCFVGTNLDGTKLCRKAFSNSTADSDCNWGIGKDYTAQKSSFNLTSSIGHCRHVFCVVWSTVYATVVYIWQSFDGSVHTRMLTVKLRQQGASAFPGWKFVQHFLEQFWWSSIIIFERSAFPDTKGVRLDRFNGKTSLHPTIGISYRRRRILVIAHHKGSQPQN